MFTSSISVDEVIDALGDYVELFLGGGKCHRAQQNRVALPAAPCAILTELTTVGLETSAIEFDPDTQSAIIAGPARIDIQIDIYGEFAGDQMRALCATFLSAWAFDRFPVHVRPLYTSDPLQTPSVTGEQQYSGRWTVTAALQYNPSVTVPQGYADVLSVTVAQADD